MSSPFVDFAVGEEVLVWSNSSNKYVPGEVKDLVKPGQIVVDRGEQVPAGAIFVEYGQSAKWIMAKDVGKMIKKKDGFTGFGGGQGNKNDGSPCRKALLCLQLNVYGNF